MHPRTYFDSDDLPTHLPELGVEGGILYIIDYIYVIIIIVLCTWAARRAAMDEYCYKSCPFREVHCMSLCKL